MNAQPSLFDPPTHRDAGETELRAATKTRCLSAQRRAKIFEEGKRNGRHGITRAEADEVIGTTPNVTQPRLAELGGYGKHERLMVQTKRTRNGCRIWVALEYATEEEMAA